MRACGFEWDGSACDRALGHAGPHLDSLSDARWPIGIPWPHEGTPEQPFNAARLCDGQEAQVCAERGCSWGRAGLRDPANGRTYASSYCRAHAEARGLIDGGLTPYKGEDL